MNLACAELALSHCRSMSVGSVGTVEVQVADTSPDSPSDIDFCQGCSMQKQKLDIVEWAYPDKESTYVTYRYEA